MRARRFPVLLGSFCALGLIALGGEISTASEFQLNRSWTVVPRRESSISKPLQSPAAAVQAVGSGSFEQVTSHDTQLAEIEGASTAVPIPLRLNAAAAIAETTADPALDDGVNGAAQASYVDGIYAIKPNYLTSYGENAWRIVTGPLRYDKNDWTNVAVVAGITGSLVIADKVLQDFIQNDVRGDMTDALADGFRELGDFENIVYGSLGAYTFAEILGAKREKAASLMVLESVLLTGLMTNGLKFVSGRRRPANTDDRYDFDGPALGDVNAAFPSGHASQAFAMASVLSEVYGDDQPWVPWVAYTVAGGAALSRVNDNRHWFSDVFLGSALGYFIGKMVVRFNPFLEDHGLTVRPLARQGTQGIAIGQQF